jgi:hypothetical protein
MLKYGGTKVGNFVGEALGKLFLGWAIWYNRTGERY